MAVKAIFQNGSTRTFTKTLYQHDKGQILIFEGIELPETFEVHFSNDEYGGVSYAEKGKNSGVSIPDAYLATGEYVYAWLYAKGSEDEGETLYTVVMPVSKRPAPLPVQEEGGQAYDYEIEDETLIITEK